MINIFHCGYYVSSPSVLIGRERLVKYYEIEVFTYYNGVAVVNNQEFELKNGMVLVSKPNDVRRTKGNYECHSLKFACDDIDLIAILESLPTVFKANDLLSLVSLFSLLYNEWKKDRLLEQDIIVRKIISILYYFKDTKDKKFTRYLKDVEKVKLYVEQNAHKKLSLRDASNYLNMSQSFFHKVFKNIVGITFGDYLTQVRVEKAKELLLNNSITIDEIADRCGFSTRAYFDNVFKKITHQTPALYRAHVNNIN